VIEWLVIALVLGVVRGANSGDVSMVQVPVSLSVFLDVMIVVGHSVVWLMHKGRIIFVVSRSMGNKLC